MTNKQVQELLIQNGQLVADTLRHLADNEIDSDYFAITSTSENGTETECELVITEYARQAAGIVDELIKALEAKDKAWSAQDDHINQQADRIESLEQKNAGLGKALGDAERRIAEFDQRIRTQNRHACELFDEAKAQRQRVAELEAREVKVKQLSEFLICHYGASEDYAKGYIDCQKNYNKALGAAGILISINGEG